MCSPLRDALRRKLIYLISFVLVLCLFQTSIANAADPSLVGWWKFDDGSGTTAIDSSGNGFDMPLHNTRNTTWEDGVFGGALHFHGSGYGYVENFNYSDNAITVCAWVQHDAFRIGEIERYVTVAEEVAVIRKDLDGSLQFYIKTDGNLWHLWGSDILEEGLWHHVAGTWDGIAQRLYINGEEIANQVPGGVLGNTSNVEMSSGGEPFNGMLDDVRIYNRALTEAGIQVIMQGEEFPYASNPYPADGAVLTDPNVILSWEPGFGAILHYVYFGDDYDVVSDATGGMPWGASTYSPGTLDSEKIYYWRVDEFDGVTTYKGDVWSFSITTPLPPPESEKIFDDDFSSESGIWTYVEVAIDDFGERYPGSAYRDITNDYLVLTENKHSQCGVVWLNQDIFSPFTVEFKYRAGGSSGRWSADGLVFMFYKNKDYEPLDGGSLGFMTIPQPMTAVSGYGIEFDNYENDLDFTDPSGNHIALIKDSVSNHIVYRDDSRTEDNRWHDVRITVGSSTIEVYVDHEMLFTWEGLIERTYGGIGFGAGTGAGTNSHLIDDVKIYKPSPPPAPSPIAFNPDPADGAKYVYPDVELSWSSGSGAQLHIVYFGDNFDDVNNSAGGILLETTTYTPGPLELDKVYYWRVDEFDGVVIHKGDVWSFTVADPVSEALDSDSHTLE